MSMPEVSALAQNYSVWTVLVSTDSSLNAPAKTSDTHRYGVAL